MLPSMASAEGRQRNPVPLGQITLKVGWRRNGVRHALAAAYRLMVCRTKLLLAHPGFVLHPVVPVQGGYFVSGLNR